MLSLKRGGSRGCLVVVVSLSAALLAAACGDEEETTPSSGGEESPAPDGTSLDVSLEDNKFSPDEIAVVAGGDFSVNLTNEGNATHNMRFAGADGEFESADDFVSDPDVIRAGEAAALQFTAPEDPGSYEFRCDFHPSEMTGAVNVK